MLVPCQEFLIFYHSDSFKINLYNTDAHMEPEGVLYSHHRGGNAFNVEEQHCPIKCNCLQPGLSEEVYCNVAVPRH